MAEAATAPDPEALVELAEMFLDDEGQVEVSVLIDEGELHRAQVYLLGALDKGMQKGDFTAEEAPELYAKLGLSTKDVERIRTNNAHHW